MNNEVQLISDGDGLAVIGDPKAVERFLISQGLDQLPSRDLGLPRLGKILSALAVTTETAATIASGSGRWVQITEESAALIDRFTLMTRRDNGLSLGVIQDVGGDGKIKGIVQFAQGPGSVLGNPAVLGGVAGIMAQAAIAQHMDEIAEYLQEINEKVDDILRAQKDAVLADMSGVGLIVDEALTVRDQVGRVSEVTWSKVQGTAMTVARTQAYALRQLDAIAEKLHAKADVGEIAKVTKEAEAKVREWLAVLARCLQLQDAIWVLEIDRVLEVSPEELDQHRIGLSSSLLKRRELIALSTASLLAEMGEAVGKANSKVLFNPLRSPAVVRSSNQVATDLLEFRRRLSIECDHQSSEARRWGEAAAEVRDRVFTATAGGVDAARRFGSQSFEQAAGAFRAVDADGDGVPGKSPVASAVEGAGSAVKGVAAGAAGSLLRRKPGAAGVSEDQDSRAEDENPHSG